MRQQVEAGLFFQLFAGGMFAVAPIGLLEGVFSSWGFMFVVVAGLALSGVARWIIWSAVEES